jgi:predicted transcriptional regulator
MVGKKRVSKRGLRTPIGDRAKVLIMIDKEIAADIKDIAMKENRAVRSVMGDAAREYLKRREQKRAKGQSPLAEPPAR